MYQYVQKNIHSSDRRRLARRRQTKRVLLSLVLCFPYGLTQMWRRNCHWHMPVKIGISALFVAAAIAVLVLPLPGKEKVGNVEMVSMEHEVEVFGPELPSDIPEGGYSYIVSDSVLSNSNGEEEEVTYVYALKGAQNYHLSDCRYAYASAQKLTPYQARFLGFTPCKICKSPEE